MSDLLLAPHNDDETLFCAYTILRHRPFVAICFRSKIQESFGISHQRRELETALALRELGDPDWSQSALLDSIEDPLPGLADYFRSLDDQLGRDEIEHVYAPAVEDGGHEHHNVVGSLAASYWPGRVRPYLTYRRGSMRSHGREVIPEPRDVAAKMRALACYASQIELPNTRPWFMDDTLREYMP